MENDTICIFAPCYNETNIIEWMDYHFKIGFNHIIIYDDQSDIPVIQTIRNYGKFAEDKYTILDNFVRQYFSGKNRTSDNLPQQTLRSDYFFNKLKPYIANYTHLLSIDLDEYLYLGSFKTIHEMVNYYKPFDHLYINWKTFKGVDKFTKSSLINNFVYSGGVEMCGKGLAKISSIHTQTSPHYLELIADDNLISKDIFNNCFKLSIDSGITNIEPTYFYNSLKTQPNIPYIAHYRNQSIESFVKRRIIDRSSLIKQNLSEHHGRILCSIFFWSNKTYDEIVNDNYWALTNINANDYVEHIYKDKDVENNNKLNTYEDGSIRSNSLNDVSKLYWSAHPAGGDYNLDMYNMYNKS